MNSILESLEGSLQREQELRARFGDDAVDAHLALLRQAQGNAGKTRRDDRQAASLPAPVAPPALPAPASGGHNQNQPGKQFPHWEADQLLSKLNVTRQDAYKMLGNSPDEFYKNLRQHGIERIDISRKNFGKIYGQLRANGKQPVNP